jgi:sulfur carrier protein ThiS
MIRIELSSVFQAICPSLQLRMDLQDGRTTVTELLHRLVAMSGGKVRSLLFEYENVVSSGLMVMVNDQIYTGTALNQKDVPLVDGDKVCLLYFVSGG